MELAGEVAINASRERVWSALNDAQVLQACVPGCEEVIEESDTVRKARVMIKVGPVRARFSGKVTLSEVVPNEGCVMSFEGSGGAAGMASGRSQIALLESPDGTRLTYTVKASVGGKLGQIGGRMMDASAKQLADQFFGALRLQLEPQVEPVAEAPAGTDSAVDGAAAATASKPAVAVNRASPVPLAPTSGFGEFSRVLWFALGCASTFLGVWLGARLF